MARDDTLDRMADTSSGVSRGLVNGVMLGLTGGALVLGVFSIQNAQRECEFPGTMECLFEMDAWAQIARLQALSSLGLILVAAGLFLFRLRGR
jgi:hypothetical protein